MPIFGQVAVSFVQRHALVHQSTASKLRRSVLGFRKSVLSSLGPPSCKERLGRRQGRNRDASLAAPMASGRCARRANACEHVYRSGALAFIADRSRRAGVGSKIDVVGEVASGAAAHRDIDPGELRRALVHRLVA